MSTSPDKQPGGRPRNIGNGAPASDASESERTRVRLEALGQEPEVARSTLSAFYDGATWATQPTEGAYSYRYAAVGDDTMTLRTSRMQGYIRGDIPPGDDFIVQWIVSGRAVVDLERDEIPLQVGRPMLFPAHRPFVFGFTDYDQKLVHLNRQHVARVAEERLPVLSQNLRFDHARVPPAAAIALWQDTTALISHVLARGEASALVWHELSRMAAVAFLEMYPPQVSPLPPELLVPRNARIRLAVEFVHENAHLPIGPAEIAQAASVPQRTLHDVFRRELDTTPLGYLRQVRLDRVRSELSAGDHGTSSVTQIARRWGFAHLGRFAAAYSQRFGEHPRATLRR